ncbi:MAG: hypothetical protein LBT54_08085 [Bifidobacteriaceae bacterium]|jgi:hypothetical protein|nr:hypothetical protein [Bifidobacteriaceae bacterium]
MSAGRTPGAGTARKAWRAPAVALATGVLLAASPAWALWQSQTAGNDVAAGSGLIGFAVARDGLAADAATSKGDPVAFALGPADAAAAQAAGGLAVAFQVQLRGDGHAGLTYGIVLPSWTAGTVFASSVVRVFPVADPAGCTPAAAPADQGRLDGLAGIATDYAPVKTAAHWWCLTAVWQPAAIGDYANTGLVTAQDPGGSPVQDSAAWNAGLLPNPDREPVVEIELAHQVWRPAGEIRETTRETE